MSGVINSPAMGERFGSYELLDKIAVGGMAEIFRARAVHGKGVRKDFVIKRIHPALSADLSFVAMFIDEARLGVSLVHGNIVPVFDFGCIDGYYYLAMEHVEGQDLAVLCGRAKIVDKPWPWQLALHIVNEVLEGLDYAHNKRDEQGRPLELVHRDVSPANILVSLDGQVKLLDFGIARSMAREYETRTGVIKGKPGYMAPEQAAGKRVDARADIWSAGAVLHELLTGQKLKDGRVRVGDERLDALVDKALKADPDDRFADAAAFQEAIGEILMQRGQRPTSSQLGRFVREVSTSAAPGENWDMLSDHVEQHLAAALAPRPPNEPPEGTKTRAGKKESLKDSEVTPRGVATAITRSLFAEKAARFWMWFIAVVAVFAAAVTAGFAMWSLPGAEPATTSSLETDPASTPPADGSELTPAELTLVVSPVDAALRVDDRSIPPQAREKLQLEPGSHHLEATKKGYRAWSLDLDVKPGQKRRLAIDLERRPGRLTVTSSPAGARVFVEGVEKGETPLDSLAVRSGPLRVRVAHKGYEPQERQVEVEAGAERRVELTLERKKPAPKAPASVRRRTAILSVNTTPWSNVTLDGRAIGNTPVLGRELSPGRHVLVMTNPVRNLTKKVVFTVKPGQHKRVTESLR